MILYQIFGALALISLLSTLWQWLVARRFPLHQRFSTFPSPPAVTLLKPLKGADEFTEACLRSWLAQEYSGKTQVLFAVSNADDPACAIVKKLLGEFPQADAQLVVCPKRLGANAKVSKLAQLEPMVKNDIIIISDADVRIPADLLANVVSSLRDEKTGLAFCFYQLANPTTPAMECEAIATNADFWSQVLQGASISKPDFALGAVMATRRKTLADIGGFRTMVDCLADDYQLGHRIARGGYRVEICPVVVECWSAPMGWRDVWRHQLRWARTIRVCQPLPYFFSIISNASLWPLLWFAVNPDDRTLRFAAGLLAVRLIAAGSLMGQLTKTNTSHAGLLLVWLKDLLQAALWVGAFAGNRIEWRGERYRLRRDGTLVKQ